MSESRAAILNRIRSGLASECLPHAEPVKPASPTPEPARPAVIDRFAEEATAAGAVVHRVGSLDAAVDAVVQVLVEAGVSRLASWEPDDLPIPELVDTLRDRGLEVQEPTRSSSTETLDRDWTELAGVDAGLTGAAGGLADTGTVVLRSGPGRARLTWLLPPLHVVVLPVPFIYPTLQAFVTARGDAVGRCSHVALVTGPSRTADIEQTLTIGVHGPKHVHLVLVDAAV